MSEVNEDILTLFRSPSSIQYKILRAMEENVGLGQIITDPNNVVSHCVESFAQMGSNLLVDMQHSLEKTFPKRALDNESLFRHMSDYDYVGLFSTPSLTDIQLTIRKDVLLNKAITEGTYKLAIIPRNTEFQIGKYRYTLHYPIHIRINQGTDTVTALYDTGYPNPIYTVVNNVLESRSYTYGGTDLIAIKIPVHQITRSVSVETLFPSTPFSKVYTFNNKFYAVRLFTDKVYEVGGVVQDYITDENNVKWTELKQSLSSNTYDPTSTGIPTVILNVDEFSKTIKLTVPYIFTMTNRLGSHLKIELMDTVGKVDIDASSIMSEEIPVRFPLTGVESVDKYTTMLKSGENTNVMLINNRIIGGSNGMSFEQLRDRIVYNSFNDQLLVTPMDLIGFYGDHGYKAKKFKDGITSRIYFCFKELRDIRNAIISSGDVATLFDSTVIGDGDDHVDGFISFPDNSFIIKPDVMYKYDAVSNMCIPMTRAEAALINATPNQDIINQLNDNVFTYSPFFTQITTTNGIPISYSYDLADPQHTSVAFVKENSSANITLSIYDTSISFDAAANRFVVKIQVTRSESYVLPSEIKVALSTIDIYGNVCVAKCDATVSEVTGVDNTTEYTIYLPTSYHIVNHSAIELEFENGNHTVNLESDFQIVCFLNSDSRPDAEPITKLTKYIGIEETVIGGVFGEYYTPLNVTNITTKFGSRLDELFNGIDIVYSESVPARYSIRMYAKYDRDLYWRDEDGDLVWFDDGGTVLLTKLHKLNEYVYSEAETETVSISEATAGTYENKYLVLDNNGEIDIIKIIPSMYSWFGADAADYEILNLITIDASNIESYVGMFSIDPEDHANDTMIENDESFYGDHHIATGVVEHDINDPMMSVGGDVIEDGRLVQYRVSMIHINKRPLYGDISSYAKYGSDDTGLSAKDDYLKSIRDLIIDHCEIVASSKDRLIPNTNIYYRPSRSIGTGLFKSSSASPENFSLEIGLVFKFYVPRHVTLNVDLQDSILKRIESIIDTHTTYTTFSVAAVIDDIRASLGDNVISIDTVGINDDINVQTLIHTEDENILNLRHILVLNSDNSIDIKRDVSVQFIAADVV